MHRFFFVAGPSCLCFILVVKAVAFVLNASFPSYVVDPFLLSNSRSVLLFTAPYDCGSTCNYIMSVLFISCRLELLQELIPDSPFIKPIIWLLIMFQHLQFINPFQQIYAMNVYESAGKVTNIHIRLKCFSF